MKKFTKKLASITCAIALVAACSIPAFAASDGWTNVTLPSLRNSKELARAKISDSYGSDHASANVTKLEGTDTMYLSTFLYVKGIHIAEDVYVGTGECDIPYDYTVAQSNTMQLRGGNDDITPFSAKTSGTCDFG